MDKKRSLLNVCVSIAFKIILVISALVSRKFLINYVGNEANGINALYTSIIGVLSIADLGIGTAISFSMYKPISENDTNKISGLHKLFTKIYRIIATVVLVAGLCLIPTLPYLAKGYNANSFNLSLTFSIMLLSVVITYLYSSNVSLINAYKNNYISTMIISIITLIQDVFQIILLYLTKSFTIYLLCKLICSFIQWIAIKFYVRKKYFNIITTKGEIDIETKKDVGKKIKAMFMHKIGSVLVNSIDSLIISWYVGVEILGKYSNYSAIMTSMISVLVLFFTPLTAIIGHMCMCNDVDREEKYLQFFHKLNLCLGIIFFVGYYATIDDLITVLFGTGLEISDTLVFVLSTNYFVQFMRNAVILFKDATGIFYNDRWKPLIEGVLNLILSIALAEWIGITGIIIATIITNLLVCHIIEPYVLYKNLFKKSPKKYYIKSYFYCLIFPLVLFLINIIQIKSTNVWLNIIVNGVISVILSIIVCSLFTIKDKNFKENIKSLLTKDR